MPHGKAGLIKKFGFWGSSRRRLPSKFVAERSRHTDLLTLQRQAAMGR